VQKAPHYTYSMTRADLAVGREKKDSFMMVVYVIK
jgi:hypothetical protein